MRTINEIIVHCSATKPEMDIGADWIRKIHVNENGWSDIGYHYIIRRNGKFEPGRPVSKIGAHCKNHNAHSIGICLVGGIASDGKPEDNFKPVQFAELQNLVLFLKEMHPGINKVSGHHDYANKACPCFNVREKIKL